MAKSHTVAFLAQQKRALIALRQQVAERLRIPTRLAREDGRDVGDLSVIDEQASFDMTLNEMTYDTLREIDQAVQRIETGTYGICEQTQELIPVIRLRALPFARMTVRAQSSLERDYSNKRRRDTGLSFDDTPEDTGSTEG